MHFRAIELERFRSFNEPTTLTFDGRQPGLYFLTGRNDAEPELGPNGAGKSSLLEGVYWSLFGRTSRKLRAGSVCTWGEKGGTQATLTFDVAGNTHELHRSWKPNKLELDGEPVDQESLDERFALDPQAFQQQVMIGQFSGMFLDLPPATKLDMFTEALQLDVWLRASAAARDRATRADGEARKIESKIARLDGQIRELEEQIGKLESRAASYVEERARERTLLEADVKERAEAVRQHESKVGSRDDDEAQAEACVRKATRVRNKLELRDSECRERVTSLSSERTKLETERASLAKERSKFDGVRDACPYCNQKVTKAHLRKELGRIDESMSDLDEQIEVIAEKMEIEQKELDAIQVELIDARAEIADAENVLRDIASAASTAAALLQSARRDLRAAEKRLEAHDENSDNPYESMARDAREKLEAARVAHDKHASDLKASEREMAASRYWQKGFREIRLMLVDNALRDVEVEANNCLGALGLMDWELSLAVESETKSGKVTRGLASTVYSPHNDEAVPFECWSGGESQRLRLAATMGLVNVLLARSDQDCNVEFWDEPTQHLSSEGVEALLDCLEERAASLHKQIWLVDHRSLSHGGFQSVVTVVKDEHGSRIEE